MKKVYSAGGLDDASLIRILLEGEGISAVIEGGFLTGTQVHLISIPCVSVLVADEDYDDARQIIAEYQPGPTECANCGYNLTGLPEARCPECGQEFYRPNKPAPRPNWICACGEEVEGQFTACWKCGYEKPVEEAEPE